MKFWLLRILFDIGVSLLSRLENKYGNEYMHKYMYIYFYVFVSIYTIENNEFTSVLPISIQYPRVYTSFFPFCDYNSFLWQWQTSPPLSLYMNIFDPSFCIWPTSDYSHSLLMQLPSSLIQCFSTPCQTTLLCRNLSNLSQALIPCIKLPSYRDFP